MKKIFRLLMIALICFTIVSCDLQIGGDEPSEYVYTTKNTDALKLTANWEGKDFIKDGIGQVTVSQNVDGDTTYFRTTKGNTVYTRYLGIDTPESTYKVEPWGFAASDFTKKTLKSASTIVLEAEGDRTDSNGRYLAWVWYRTSDTKDFRLLNLEIVENALANPKGYSSSKYADSFSTASDGCRAAKVRIYGETDPSYDASKIGTSYTIKELRENFSTLVVEEQNQYKGKVVRTTGIVTQQAGIGSGYLQSYDEETGEYYNIYVYGGFTGSDLKTGREVFIQGKIGYYNGSLQITDLDRKNSGITKLAPTDLDIHAVNDNFHIEENVSIQDLQDPNLQCAVVTLTNLTVTKYYNTKNDKGVATGAYTLTCKDSNGKTISIRVADDVAIKIVGENDGVRITDGSYFVGRTLTSVYAVCGWYSQLNAQETEYAADGVQLLIFSGDAITLSPKAE